MISCYSPEFHATSHLEKYEKNTYRNASCNATLDRFFIVYKLDQQIWTVNCLMIALWRETHSTYNGIERYIHSCHINSCFVTVFWFYIK